MPTVGSLAAEISARADQFNGVMKKAERSAGRFVGRLERQVETYGMSRNQAKLYKLAQRGVSDQTLEAARRVTAQKEALDEQYRAQKKAKRIIESTRTPFERYQEQVEELRDLQRRGALTAEQYGRALHKVSDEARRAGVATSKIRKLGGRLRTAGRGARVAGRQFAFLSARLFTVGGAIAAVATGGGMALLTSRQFALVDALAKTADRLGTTTQRLAGLRHAAALTGVEANTVDMAMQRMVRRIAEAANGSGEAKTALRELGVDAARLSRMDPALAFRRIAGAMERVENQSDKVRLAFKLFDSEGAALVNTLDLTAKGLVEAQREAERLGVAPTRLDSAKIEIANDAIHRMQQAMIGVARTIAIEVAPWVTAVARQIREWVPTAEEVKRFMGRAMDFVAKAIGRVFDWIEDTKAASLRFGSNMLLVAADVVDALTKVANAVQNISDKFGGFRKMADFVSRFSPLGGAIDFMTGEGDHAEQSTARAASGAGILRAAAKRLQDQFEALTETQNNSAEAGRSWYQQWQSFLGELQESAEEVARKSQETGAAMARQGINREATKQAEELVKRLSEQVTLFGKAGRAAEIYRLEQDGASGAILDRARALDKQLTRMEQEKQKTDQITSAMQALRQEHSELMGAGPIRELIDLGATERQINEARRLMGQIERMQEAQELQSFAQNLIDQTRTPVETFRRQVLRIRDAFGAGFLPGEAAQRGVMAQVETLAQSVAKAEKPLKRYESVIGELSKALQGGAIGWDAYREGVRKAREQLEKTSEKQRKAEQQIGGEVRTIDLSEIKISGLQALGGAGRKNPQRQQAEALRRIDTKMGRLLETWDNPA